MSPILTATTETTSYDLQRLDMTVLALGALLITAIIIKHWWDRYHQ